MTQDEQDRTFNFAIWCGSLAELGAYLDKLHKQHSKDKKQIYAIRLLPKPEATAPKHETRGETIIAAVKQLREDSVYAYGLELTDGEKTEGFDLWMELCDLQGYNKPTRAYLFPQVELN